MARKRKYEVLATRIKELRLTLGYSQTQLAAKLHMTQPAVQMWERGESAPPVCRLLQICDVFGVTPNYMLGYDSEFEAITDETLKRLETFSKIEGVFSKFYEKAMHNKQKSTSDTSTDTAL